MTKPTNDREAAEIADTTRQSELIAALEANDCTWTQEDLNSNAYSTSCGQAFLIVDGTPEDNGFKFCCFCGKELWQELFEIREALFNCGRP